MNLDKAKEIIATFIKVEPDKIKNDTRMDKSVISGSIFIHRMYSLLSNSGYNVSDRKTINTYGDFLKRLDSDPSKNHCIEDNSQKITLENCDFKELGSEISSGIDIEEITNMPVVDDFREDPFYKNVFSNKEISYCILQVNPYASFAGKFAAKEAVVKADNNLMNVPFNKIEILNDSHGKPYFKDFSLSISHTDKQAIAMAVKSGMNKEGKCKSIGVVEKKKILFTIDWYLPGYKAGGPVRSMANMVDHLVEKFDIYIITRNTDYMESVPYKKIISNDWNRLSGGEYVYYVPENDVSFKFYKRMFSCDIFDVIYIHGVYSWRFSILPLIVAKITTKIKIVVAVRGMLADYSLKIKTIRKKLFFTLAKLMFLYRRVCFHATNKKEQNEIFRIISKRAQVFVVKNLPANNTRATETIRKDEGCLKLVSLTRIAPEKNTLFAIKILSRLINKNYSIQYDIYGQIYDKSYWTECLSLIEELPENICVNYKGTANPDKIFEILSSYHSLFLPSQGENFGHAILETLNAGRPVIISNKTPWRNLEENNAGWDIPLEDSKKFIEAIEKLVFMEQKEFDKITKSTIKYVGSNYNLSTIVQEYCKMLNK